MPYGTPSMDVTGATWMDNGNGTYTLSVTGMCYGAGCLWVNVGGSWSCVIDHYSGTNCALEGNEFTTSFGPYSAGTTIIIGSTGDNITAPTGGDSYTAGDPHFMGFDGQEFHYHGRDGGIYRLWSGAHTVINALFKTFQVPGMEDTTIMATIFVDCPAGCFFVSAHRSLFAGTPLIRRSLEGNPHFPPVWVGMGGEYLDTDGGVLAIHEVGELIFTRMEYGGVKFLNLGIKPLGQFVVGASGILGQTMWPVTVRKANDSFEVPGIDYVGEPLVASAQQVKAVA